MRGQKAPVNVSVVPELLGLGKTRPSHYAPELPEFIDREYSRRGKRKFPWILVCANSPVSVSFDATVLLFFFCATYMFRRTRRLQSKQETIYASPPK